MNLQRRRRRVYCSLSIPEVKQACQLIRGVLRAQIRNGPALGGVTLTMSSGEDCSCGSRFSGSRTGLSPSS